MGLTILQDHPRIRGEHASSSWSIVDSFWIIPAYAGAPDVPVVASGGQRIIPAYAGSTPRAGSGPGAGSDHPRIRGEHFHIVRQSEASGGSSPHTRGAPLHTAVSGATNRIIPAYAGSTPPSGGRALRCPDHPRIRGEHPVCARHQVFRSGSSPHTRGARGMVSSRGWGRRIIPAYAGSTTSSPPPGVGRGDHPRIRGEHVAWCQVAGGVGGSSPHTRGARQPKPRNLPEERIIPAYAGSTRILALAHRLSPDHPRIRGEHAGARAYTPSRPGSSPHTRGAPGMPRIVP